MTSVSWGPGGTALDPSLLKQEKPKIARIFTSYVQVDPKTRQPARQFFDVPLAPSPTMPHLTPWAAFMTNLLTHRGILVNNAWVPERMIELILVNPEQGGLPETMAEAGNVVMLRPVTPPAGEKPPEAP